MRFGGKQFCVLVAGEPYRVVRCNTKHRVEDGRETNLAVDTSKRIIWVYHAVSGDLLAAELALAVSLAWREAMKVTARAASQMPQAERMDHWEKDLVKTDYEEALAKILGEGGEGSESRAIQPSGIIAGQGGALKPQQESRAEPVVPAPREVARAKPAERKKPLEQNPKLIAEAIRVVEAVKCDREGRMTCPYCLKAYKAAGPMARHLHGWHEDEVVGRITSQMIRERLWLLQRAARAADDQQKPKA